MNNTYQLLYNIQSNEITYGNSSVLGNKGRQGFQETGIFRQYNLNLNV